ncbi:MAG: alpha/beta hydrolase [Sinimarinibacterium sp.]|jgi:pimeloyl-ACP methyl ester carboxylesterase
MQRARFSHSGIGISYLDSAPGDMTRPAVLLLHGFPDSAEMWRSQIEALHGQGFRAIAPDMRGYGESDIAARTADYAAKCVRADYVALLDHLGIERADVVGHDWGAVFAWMLAGYHPARVRRLVAISVGHPTAYARAGLGQKIAGWYTLYFLIRGLSERLLAGSGLLSLRRLLRSHPQMDEVQRRMWVPERLTAALRVYRANLFGVLFRRHPAVSAPTLGIWSERDAYLVESQMTNSRRFANGFWTYERLSGGHWIPLEQARRLNGILLRFLSDRT